LCILYTLVKEKNPKTLPVRPSKPMLPKKSPVASGPEPSMEEWIKAGVPETILTALKEEGFSKPTSIQVKTLVDVNIG